ncbi:uncharacterized protein LOC105279640, partial [Ooceraea biroi]|uniref:uncharacterized protein LOC105279640 n=1 Tax=Ooceraea biroi TaxID=2015173 RepID=UPI000F086F1C
YVAAVSSTFAYRYDPWYRADTLRPVDAITDTVNDLGMKILQQYTAHGNVAFSPTGVAFVLAALYEGSAGRGNKQIAKAMNLPLNRDITRIGFRDIHRRLRSYLNADGFLGGLTLSRENTKLRSEYEDILRFYGFDLSSMEQEASVTISMENSSTTELSTIDLTSPLIETIRKIGNVRNATTMSMDTITSITILSSSVEATTIPSTATSTTQQIVAISTDTNAQTISTSVTVTDSPAIIQNTLATQSTDSLTVVTSGESVQSSAGAENMMSLSRTINPAMSTGLASTASTDSETSSSTITMIVLANDQSLQMTSIVTDNISDTGTTGSVAISMSTDTQTILTPTASSVAVTQNTTTQSTNSLTAVTSSESIQPSLSAGAESMGASVTMAVLINGSDATTSMGVDNEISSVFTANTQVPMTTNVPSPDLSTMIADTSTEALAAAATTVNMMLVNMSATNKFNTITSTTLNSANVTATGISTTLLADTTEMTMLEDFITMPLAANAANVNATVMVSLTDETTMVPSVEEINFTSSNFVENSNNSAIANSTMNSTLVDVNQIPIDQSNVSPNRKKRTAGTKPTESGSNLNGIMSAITNGIIHGLNNPNGSNLRKRRARSSHGYFSNYPDEGIWMQNLKIWKSYGTKSSESSTGDTTAEISFLVNGCDVSSVSASRYIAVLPFAYFPSLHAVALEFPLDDPRYNIILLMPTDKTDVHHLARDLNGKSLRLLRKRLQSTWVKATIPSFMLRGFVTLTSFLQRLGILDVFDPNTADLSPMTSDLGVYARDIQQSIGINIRNYMKPDRTHSRESSNIVPPRRDYYQYLFPGNGLFERAEPVPFTALHPFLYFIIDTETSVSLIAGRIDDPLNSRIL